MRPIPIMEPSRSNERRLAPSCSRSSRALSLPGHQPFEPPPYHDERLVRPETREEMIRGQRIRAMPARPEHGDRHSEVDYVVRGNVRDGYTSSSDLLTRAGPRSDFATDTCIRRSGVDPRTGDRYLEELAFEVVNTQSLRHMIIRAEDLTACGVRRLVGIFVKKGTVCEWSAEHDRWIPLDLDDALHDPTLVRPIPVRALLDAAAADDAVVRALEAKGNRRIEEIRSTERRDGRAEGLRDGRAEGLVRAIETACTVLDVPLSPLRRQQLEALGPVELEALLRQLETKRCWPTE